MAENKIKIAGFGATKAELGFELTPKGCYHLQFAKVTNTPQKNGRFSIGLTFNIMAGLKGTEFDNEQGRSSITVFYGFPSNDAENEGSIKNREISTKQMKAVLEALAQKKLKSDNLNFEALYGSEIIADVIVKEGGKSADGKIKYKNSNELAKVEPFGADDDADDDDDD